MLFTVYFHFTEGNPGVIRIPFRIRRMSPVVVVDNVSTVVRTGDVDSISNCDTGVDGVPKTQHSVIFVCCVGNVHREPKEPPSQMIVFI